MNCPMKSACTFKVIYSFAFLKAPNEAIGLLVNLEH